MILAGDEKDKDKDNENGFLFNKALVEIQGKAMIQYIIKALRQSDAIEEIYVVGQLEGLGSTLEEVDGMILATGSIIDNVETAIKSLGDEEPLLIVTCDIPLLRAEAVNNFIEQTKRYEADLYYPVISRFLCQEKYPDVKRTYVTLKEGLFTGGNLFLLNPMAMESLDQVGRGMVRYRKNPLQMARILGFGFLLRFMLRQVGLEDVERHIEDRFYIRAKAIISDYPEIGNDIDRLEDIEILGKYLS
ncbi:nucleotidyltransferase family protein [Alkaliphilus metalliredigens]|nr:nucleotidyltransferase family protein [Alkaliphilus metalliredigens]